MSRRRNVLAAPDKFRGSATAPDVAAAIAAAAETAGWTCTRLPLADGGEGTVDALGGANRTSTVTGPLGEPVDAGWRIDERGHAVIEMARASGLDLAGGRDGNDPFRASTRGTGELVAAAVAEGATRIIVGMGGSATTDGGLGAVDALEHNARFGTPGSPELLVACDVRTSFVDAARVFGPQKGATPDDVEVLTRRLTALQHDYRARFAVDLADLPGAGAAGGLAGGLVAIGGRLVPGFELIAEETDLVSAIRAADIVVTGEGKLDDESFNGKVVGGVAELAVQHSVPVLAVVGAVAEGTESPVPVVSILDAFGSQAAWDEPLRCVEQAVGRHLAGLG